MSNLQRVTNIFIGDGTALPAAGSLATATLITPGIVDVIGVDMNTIAASSTVADNEFIYLVEGRLSVSNSRNEVKRSMKIPGRKITSYLGQSYVPAARDVWAIGYNRQSTTGSIDVTNDADYQFYIRFKNPKFLFSERMMRRSYTFRSATSATQLSIATQIADAINADLYAQDYVEAVVVGNGTGQYGLTAATAWGVEVTAKLVAVTQANSTYFLEERVYFTIELETFATAFGATTATQIENMTYGKGTYNQVRLSERKWNSYEGTLNYTLFPIPQQTYSASSTMITSSNVTAAGNVTSTINLDVISFATTNSMFRPGEIIDINGTQYEIKYLIGSTQAVLTSLATATYTGANIKIKFKYDVVIVEFSNPNLLEGSGVSQDNRQMVAIAVPSIDSGNAYTSQSAQLTSLLAKLNPYMASLGFANLSL